MTRQEFIDDIDQLSPANMALLARAAQLLRAAKEAGDERPALAILTEALGGSIEQDDTEAPPCS